MMMIMSMGWDCLWTAATNRPIVHPQGDIWAWRTVVDDVNWGKLPIHPPERSLAILPAEPSSKKLGGSGHRKWWILSMKYFFHTLGVLVLAVKSYNRGPLALLSLQRKVCCRFFTLKNPLLRLGLYPRT
jgi:hypothetical protein